jgi:peroxiredoxin
MQLVVPSTFFPGSIFFFSLHMPFSGLELVSIHGETRPITILPSVQGQVCSSSRFNISITQYP